MYLCKKIGISIACYCAVYRFKSSAAVSVAVGRVKMMINDNPDLLREVDEVMERIREGRLKWVLNC
jgi:hypothetical protein